MPMEVFDRLLHRPFAKFEDREPGDFVVEFGGELIGPARSTEISLDPQQFLIVGGIQDGKDIPLFTIDPSATTEISVDAPPAVIRWPRTPTAIFSSWHSIIVLLAPSHHRSRSGWGTGSLVERP